MILVVLASATQVGAVTSGTVVSATIPTATTLTTTACASGDPGRTTFGVVLPDSKVVTSTDCSLTFGSSNGTARLSVLQTDRSGRAMTQPATGALDVTFDADGVATGSTAPGASYDYAQAVAVRPGGEVLIAGACDMGSGTTGTDACLMQLRADGTPDTTFDGDGRVTSAIASGAGYDYWYGVALDSNGRSVSAGTCDMPVSGRDLCVARHTSTGAIDGTFGTSGVATLPMSDGALIDLARGVLIQPDGGIVTYGDCYRAATNYDFCSARWNSNGSLDTSYGAGGAGKEPIAAGNLVERPFAGAIAGNGDIVLAGTCDTGGATGHDACLLRLDPSGRPVASFGAGGRVTTPVGPGAERDELRSLLIQPDGRIVAIGYCSMTGTSGIDLCLVRYLADGSLDSSFGGDGIVTTAIAPGTANDAGFDLELQSDGLLVAAGECDMGGAGGFAFCVARYRTDGSLDSSFGTSGTKTIDMAPGTSSDWARAMAVADDRVVVAGHCDFGAGASGWDMCAVRMARGGAVDQYANPTSGWSSVDTSHFAMCLRAVTSATAAWTTTGTCGTTDGAHWRAVPTTSELVATSDPNQAGATAAFRFGLRTRASQPPGSYAAPISFDVVAP